MIKSMRVTACKILVVIVGEVEDVASDEVEVAAVVVIVVMLIVDFEAERLPLTEDRHRSAVAIASWVNSQERDIMLFGLYLMLAFGRKSTIPFYQRHVLFTALVLAKDRKMG